MEAAAIALNQKVVDEFLKVCAEGEGARQGTRPQRPVSPLLSPLLIFSSFLSFNLFQVFFPSLYLLSFLFSSLSLSIISFLFPSFILPSLFLLSHSLSLPLFLPFSLFSPPSFLTTLLFPSFLSLYPLSNFFLFSIFFSVSLFLTSFLPFSILLRSLIPSFSVPLSF